MEQEFDQSEKPKKKLLIPKKATTNPNQQVYSRSYESPIPFKSRPNNNEFHYNYPTQVRKKPNEFSRGGHTNDYNYYFPNVINTPQSEDWKKSKKFVEEKRPLTSPQNYYVTPNNPRMNRSEKSNFSSGSFPSSTRVSPFNKNQQAFYQDPPKSIKRRNKLDPGFGSEKSPFREEKLTTVINKKDAHKFKNEKLPLDEETYLVNIFHIFSLLISFYKSK